MRTAFIIIGSPLPDHGSGVTQVWHQYSFRHSPRNFPLQLSMLSGFSRLNHFELNAMRMGPSTEGFARKHRSLISTDRLGVTAKAGHLIQNAGDIMARDGEIYLLT